MMQVTTQICHVDTCTRPGCSRDAGCQGHATRERAPEWVKAAAGRLVADAGKHGLVLTIEQHPLLPLAMGNYETRVAVRPARVKS